MEAEVKKEENLSKCTGCEEIKPRIQNGMYPDGRNKRWTDVEGKLWVGRRCPECVTGNMKVRMKATRAKGELSTIQQSTEK